MKNSRIDISNFEVLTDSETLQVLGGVGGPCLSECFNECMDEEDSPGSKTCFLICLLHCEFT